MDKLENLKCLIVNWDGVCVSTFDARHAAYQAAFSAIGQGNRNWTEADTQAQTGRNPDTIWADTSLWGEQAKKAKEVFYQTYIDLLPTHLRINAVAAAFLTVFRVQHPDIPVIAFGAKNQILMEKEIKRLLPEGSFDDVYGSITGSETNKHLDSNVALGKIMTDKLLTPADNIVYLGYKKSDMYAAMNAGIRFAEGQSFMIEYLYENSRIDTSRLSDLLLQQAHCQRENR